MYYWLNATIIGFCLQTLSCSHLPPQSSPGKQETPAASIGVATMKQDGTIVLQLRAEQPNITGDSLILYPPNDPNYAKILKHIGGLRPGETKNVPPWPEP